MEFPLFGDLIVGGIKIKDGLFIGDTYAAQDIEFIFNNKITHIINCSCTELPNHFEGQGIEYLGVPWEETDTQILFDQRGQTLAIICEFVEKARELGESVLIHSVKGQSRASCAICAYLMQRYRWGFYKTLEFLDSRRPDLEIRRNFFEQLKVLADNISKKIKVSNDWNTMASVDPETKQEEIVIRNTFLNSKIDVNAPNMYIMRKKSRSKKKKGEKKRQKIKWADKTGKKRSIRTGVLPCGDLKRRLSYDRNATPEKGILKTRRINFTYLKEKIATEEREKLTKDLNSKNVTKTEPPKQVKPQSVGASLQRGKRSASSKRRDDSGSRPNKRLLGEVKKKRKTLSQSNSSKRLDSVKSAKRGGTPRRRKDGSDSTKKISNSYSRKQESEDHKMERKPNGYSRPPIGKKAVFNSALEKYKNESKHFLTV